MHCKQHTQKPICTDIQDFSEHISLLKFNFFLIFFLLGVQQTAKNFTCCWFWLGELHKNGLSGHVYRVPVVLNPMTLLLNLYGKQFSHKSKYQEKIIITQKVLVTQSSNIVCRQHTQKPGDVKSLEHISLLKFIFFKICLERVKQSAKKFTFCCFWLGKMHWNGFSSAYLGFEVSWIQWCCFWVSMVSSS